MVDAYWQAKITEGEHSGKRILYGAEGVGNAGEIRSFVTIGDGPIPVFGVDLFSDPTNKLTIILRRDNSFGYLGGRGLGIAKDAIYCFGFIGGTKVGDDELRHLKDMKNLQSLDLSGTAVTDADLQQLGNLNGLQSLTLWNTTITDAGLGHLKDLKALKWLDLSGTVVTDKGLELLKGLNNLQKLHVEKTKVTGAGSDSLKKSLPNCGIYREW